MGQFVNGLKEEVKAELRLLNPLSLEQAMEMAGRIEVKNRVVGLKNGGISQQKSGSYSLYNNPSIYSPSLTGSQASTVGPKHMGWRVSLFYFQS